MKYTIFAFLLFSFLTNNIFPQQLDYPKAKRVGQIDDYFGEKIADPYRWMEDETSDELKTWIKSQDELLKNFVGSNEKREAIRKRITELVKFDSFTNGTGVVGSAIQKRGAKYFFIKTNADRNQPILYVKENLNAEPKVLLDFSDNKMSFSGYDPSPNGRFIALISSLAASRWQKVEIFDTATGKKISDELNNLHRLGGGISWEANNKGFYYTKFEKEVQSEGQPPVPANPKLFYHELGNLQEKDRLIYEEKANKNTLFSYQTTADGKFLIIQTINGNNPNNRILFKQISVKTPETKTLFGEEDAIYTFLGNKENLFYFFTNNNAPRGKIIAVNLDKPNDLKEIIPQTKEPISAGSSVGGNAIGIFGDKIVLLYMRDSNPIIKIFDLQGKLEKEISLPSGGTIWGGFLGSQNDSEVFYGFLSLTTTGTFYRLDVNSKQNGIFLEPNLKINRADYETKQVFFNSKDGTRVPMFIAYRKGLKLDGNNPAFMYGYGALGWVAFMWYQPHILAWLDMGGVYAVPGIRGGGEYGEDWHQAGIKENKQNSVDDYIAAAEFLIKNKYTGSKKLVANGGSVSSAVAAAASIIQRPDLFGASVIDIPVFDMLRYQKFANGRFWISEFGSAENEKDYKFLKTFSPYHNLKVGKCYPPTLVMVGEKDQVASPLHAYKFTANLQYSQGCQNPVLMKMMWGAGHNFGSTADQRIDSWTDELSFLFEVLK